MRVLDLRLTSGILDRGGTILGTSRVDPFEDPQMVKKIRENYKRSGIDALIAVGGESTLKIALELYKEGCIKVVGVPKSIDNALSRIRRKLPQVAPDQANAFQIMTEEQ